MSPQHNIFEFHDSHCLVSVWQSAKGEHVLAQQVRVPLAARPLAPPPGPQVPEPGAPAAATPLQPAMAQQNGEAIKEALKNAGIKARDGLAIIPKQWVNLRVVTLPSADPDELAEMARFEAERHIPFDAERHIVSHYVAASEEIQGSKVMIAALDQPPADEVTEALDAAGILVRGLDVSTSALINALMHSGQWDREADPTVAHVNLGENATDINILHEGIPLFARSIALGVGKLMPRPAEAPASQDAGEAPQAPAAPPADLEELARIDLAAASSGPQTIDLSEPTPSARAGESAAAWLNRLIQEIQRTYGYAQREFECRPLTRVFISGPGTALGNIESVLRMALEVEAEPLKTFSQGLKKAEDKQAPTGPDAAHAMSAGALLRLTQSDAVSLNLLPEQYVRKHASSQRKQSLLTSVTLVVALIVCAFVYADQTMRERRRQLAYYAAEVNKSQARTDELERKRMVIKILEQNTSREGSALAILNTLSSWGSLWQDAGMRVSITEFLYTAQRYVKITGHALSVEDQNDFMTKLEQSGHFDRVLLESRTTVAAPYVPRQRILRFTVNCYFRGEENAAR